MRSIMGASLGLLAFMLAFAFSAGQSHFESRTQELVNETSVIAQACRAAEMLEDPARSRARSQLATWTLAVAFSAVIALIMDLDRPIMTLFDVNDQIMIDLKARMDAGE